MATIQEALLFAFDLHQTNRVEEADAIYRQILDAVPDHPDALHLHGLVLAGGGDLEGAADHIGRAIAGNRGNADYHANLASVLELSQRHDEAAGHLAAAVALDPSRAGVLNNFATRRLRDDGLPEAAARVLHAAAEAAPLSIEVRHNLALALARLGRDREAADQHRVALLLAPDDPDNTRMLGETLYALEERGEAARLLRRAVRLAPTEPGSWNLLSNLWKDGHLAVEGALPLARYGYQRGLSLAPAAAEMWNNLSNALKGLHDHPGALAASRRAHRADPESAEILHGLAEELLQCGEPEAGLEAADAALALDPALPNPKIVRAMALLTLGRFAEGWIAWEDRWTVPTREQPAPQFDQPAWDGRPLASGRLLVWGEQGIGDEIHYAALVPALARAGIGCVLECDARLRPLFERSLPEVAVIARPTLSDPQPPLPRDIAAHCPSGSLPRFVLGDAGPVRIPPFLKADPARVAALRARDAVPGGPRLIGIAWNTKSRPARNIPLATLARSLARPGVRLLVLQYGDWAEEVAALAADGVDIGFPPGLDLWNDMDGLAAQIAATDLVVSIDNMTVHMAGALGHPVWILLPKSPDWRWQHERTDSPWYPSARLFRQRTMADWQAPLDSVRDALSLWLAEPAPQPANWPADRPADGGATRGGLEIAPPSR